MCPKLWVVLVLIRPVLACLLSQGSSGRFTVPLRLLYDDDVCLMMMMMLLMMMMMMRYRI